MVPLRISVLLCTNIIFIVIVNVNGVQKNVDKIVPGCTSEKAFDFSIYSLDNVTQNQLDEIPKCFCDEEDDHRIKIACYFTSNVTDLAQALGKVQASKKILKTIFISNMEFNSTGIPGGFFRNYDAKPEQLIIQTCNGNDKWLSLYTDTFGGMEETLKQLKIYDCILPEFPQGLSKMVHLEKLVMNKVFIHSLAKEDFALMKNLKHLEMTDNQLWHIGEDSFTNLSKLETLILGPTNSLNESYLPEINKIKSLKHLDLQLNSMKDIPDYCLSNLNNTEYLNLQANLIPRIRRHSFSGMTNLKFLDMSLNNLNYMEFSAFDEDLSNLVNLSLWGNNLENLESKTFYNLQSLEILDMSYNVLPSLYAQTFQTNSKLRILNLYKNVKLSNIDDQTFYGAEELQSLKLSATNLSQINAQTFKGLQNLKELDLSETPIDDIDPNAFKTLPNLQKLYLNKTHLQALDKNLVMGGHHFSLLDISSNRWDCDKQNLWFIKYVQENAGVIIANPNETQCWMPLESRGAPLTDLDPVTLKPLHTPSPIGNSDDDNNFLPGPILSNGEPSLTTQLPPANIFNQTVGYTSNFLNQDFDHLAGFHTAAPKTNQTSGLSDDTIKIIIICCVSMGLILTALIVGVIIMIRRRKLSKSANSVK
uniref:Uncharacterized protein n=1 Tax=Romanomermis culicivorax TaxID=13658 RepID=A0A915HF39_ROMCU